MTLLMLKSLGWGKCDGCLANARTMTLLMSKAIRPDPICRLTGDPPPRSPQWRVEGGASPLMGPSFLTPCKALPETGAGRCPTGTMTGPSAHCEQVSGADLRDQSTPGIPGTRWHAQGPHSLDRLHHPPRQMDPPVLDWILSQSHHLTCLGSYENLAPDYPRPTGANRDVNSTYLT